MWEEGFYFGGGVNFFWRGLFCFMIYFFGGGVNFFWREGGYFGGGVILGGLILCSEPGMVIFFGGDKGCGRVWPTVGTQTRSRSNRYEYN